MAFFYVMSILTDFSFLFFFYRETRKMVKLYSTLTTFLLSSLEPLCPTRLRFPYLLCSQHFLHSLPSLCPPSSSFSFSVCKPLSPHISITFYHSSSFFFFSFVPSDKTVLFLFLFFLLQLIYPLFFLLLHFLLHFLLNPFSS